jgi:hypothetical protein
VDAADYVMWRKVGGPMSGYNVWLTNYGRSPAGGGLGQGSRESGVPEPDAMVLIFGAILYGSVIRRQF